MFYSEAKNDNAIIRLGIKQNAQWGYHIPKIFFIEKVSSKTRGYLFIKTRGNRTNSFKSNNNVIIKYFLHRHSTSVI